MDNNAAAMWPLGCIHPIVMFGQSRIGDVMETTTLPHHDHHQFTLPTASNTSYPMSIVETPTQCATETTIFLFPWPTLNHHPIGQH